METANLATSAPRTGPDAIAKAFASNRPVYATPARHLHSVRRFGKLVAGSSAMHEVFDVLARFAPTDVSVTLLGETGTGKDVVAHALHEQSSRAGGPFVVFDCGAIAPNLAESELFGHERGAFTGAVSTHAGAFERAHGGTLFLDEIGELPIDLQPRLLRVLESRRVRRVGGTQDRPLDVRIVAATHRDLRADVAAGRFRQDLYFRLGAAVVAIPALRERFDDLPLLVPALLEDLGRTDLRVAEGTLTALRGHAWPGNVRELKNALACAVAFVEEGAHALEPRHLRLLPPANVEDDALERLPLGGQKLEVIERVAIKQTLLHTDGNKAQAAQALGIAVSTLYEKLKKYRLAGEKAPESGAHSVSSR
jgi:two-component system, NtrC family, response regulator